MFIVKEILEATGGRLVCGRSKGFISGVSTDTRSVKPGDLFIALKGPNFDGHNFVEEAIRKGASGAIVSAGARFTCPERSRRIAPVVAPVGNGFAALRATGKSNPYILINVKDTLKAYGDIAHHYRMKFDIPLMGITGSNGKTTTKDMIYKVLSSKFHVLKNEGTENNLIGVSKTLLKLNAKHDIAVLELGTNHFGEIARLAEIVKAEAGIITNIGPAHLEFLKSIKGVLREKIELLNRLGRGGLAVLNADDALLSGLKRAKCKIVTFGIDKAGDFRATRIFQYDDAAEFIVNDRYEFKFRPLGRHNIYNALAAIAAGFSYKIDYDDIYKALSEFESAEGRTCLKKAHLIDIIDDTYNSNPQSFRAALEVLSNYKTSGRKIVVCGDMLELGRVSMRLHKEAGRLIFKSGAAYLIGVGRFSGAVRQGAVSSGMDKDAIFSCRDNAAAIEALKKIVKEGDAVLLKGSRLIKLDEVVDVLSSFIPAKRDMVRV